MMANSKELSNAVELLISKLAQKATWYDEIMYRLEQTLIDTGYCGRILIAQADTMEWIVSVEKQLTHYGNPAEAVNAFIVEVAKVLHNASTEQP